MVCRCHGSDELVKAVVLAGGFGTRLRPLTNLIPKPLVPIAGTPLIQRIMNTIPSSVEEVIVAAGYRAGDIEKYFETREQGIAVKVVTEHRPLGTAGALWNLRNSLDSTFFVLNGDVLNSLPLEQMHAFHEQRGALATISLWKVPDPSAFGIVRLEDGSVITEFKEKPTREEAFSNLINAGTYIMTPEIFEHMNHENFSLEREIFPMLTKGRLHGFTFDGYWIDCGSREMFLRAQNMLMDREKLGIEKSVKIDGCSLNRPVAVERGARLRGVRLGPNAYIEKGAKIEEGSSVENSAVLANSSIGRNCRITGSIICPGAVVGDSTVSDNQILGEPSV